MKKIISIFTLICICLSLCACTQGYDAPPSTEAEARVCLTLNVFDKEYEVKYELWRALYLNYKTSLDPSTDGYKDKINALVLDKIADIYAVMALCEKLGINLYSSAVNKQIDEYIKTSIEGNGIDEGYADFDKYLEALKEMNLNYQAHVLLLRYAIGLEELDKHYIGTFDADDIQNGITVGDITYTREDVKEFYYSDKCVRVLRTHLQAGAYYEPEEYAITVRDRMISAAQDGESAVAGVIISTGLTALAEVERGYVIAKNNLDKLYYSELTEAAFSLGIGDVSEPIFVNYGEGDVIFILYRGEKSDTHFDKAYSEIAYVYLTDTVGARIAEVKGALLESAQYTDLLETIDYSKVSMNE